MADTYNLKNIKNKKYLQFLLPQDQIYEINSMIHDFNKTNWKGENINKKFCISKELKALKKEIILNHEKYLCEKYLN